MKKWMLSFVVLSATIAHAQFGMSAKDDSWKKNYRATATKENDLVHTKLQAKFDYQNAQMMGKVWLLLKPHFFATNHLALDAKAMDIKSVEIVKGLKQEPLAYTYENNMLNIKLDKEYKANETYTIYIDYIAKPNDYKAPGSAAITDAKGLYFINPKGEDKDKPTQIWTQGETESTSVWVPTIDKPNQKSTQEFFITVPSKYVTLSNGKLVSQTKVNDSTRTDYWKMDLPHAPYLFFMGIGEYSIIKDTYKGKEVNYYVEKAFEKVAKKIFGNTPEMMKFYSEKVTGVEYPWNKYSQIVGKDYVSGAMENTTATLHQESAQQNARQLTDGNAWEGTIAHELFHQWFGDYVTAESWSNLTVNESFANYSQVLWNEYKYGKDAGDEENDNDMQGYIRSRSEKKDLVRFYYADKEDMFDAVSYNKGGRILHMLRNYVGDSAFFKSLNRYLTDNKFGTGSAHKLRMAFEAVTGKDLNWYFNQWYFGSGHPNLDIHYDYLSEEKKARVIITQTQAGDKVFKFPLAIDVYANNEKTTHNVWVESKADTFLFPCNTIPQLINADADKVLLAEKKENKNAAEYLFQYKNAKKYMDRKEAIDFASKHKSDEESMSILKAAIKDSNSKLKTKAITELEDTTVDAGTIAVIEKIAIADKDRKVRAEAIDFLASTHDAKYRNMFVDAAKDSSYTLAGAGLEALGAVDEKAALDLLPILKKDMKGRLKQAIEKTEVLSKTDDDFDQMYKDYNKKGLMEKFTDMNIYLTYLGKVNNTANFKKAIDALVAYRDMVAPYGPGIKEGLNKNLRAALKPAKLAAGKKGLSQADMDEQIKYLEDKTAD